jgi:hypothetical protein
MSNYKDLDSYNGSDDGDHHKDFINPTEDTDTHASDTLDGEAD